MKTVLPRLAFVGKINNIRRVYLIINYETNTFTYQFTSVVEALDVCFKFFLAFKVPFTNTYCPHVWTFLQAHIYQVQNTRDYKSVTDLCSLLTQ